MFPPTCGSGGLKIQVARRDECNPCVNTCSQRSPDVLLHSPHDLVKEVDKLMF